MDAALTTTPERPVFVATDDRRARRLRYLAAIAIALAGAWVAALALGVLSIGRLPGLALPVVAHGAEKAPAADGAGVTSESAPVGRLSPARTRSGAAAPSTRPVLRQPRPVAVDARGATARTKLQPTKPKATPRARTARAATPPSAAPTSTTARQGWARRGLTTPPGRARPTKPKARPAEAPGHTRQHTTTDPTTAPVTPVATPVPPGQQKKADDPKHQG